MSDRDLLGQVLAGSTARLAVTVTQGRSVDRDPTVARLQRMRDNRGRRRVGPTRAVTAGVRGDHSPPGVPRVSAAATAVPAPRVSGGQR